MSTRSVLALFQPLNKKSNSHPISSIARSAVEHKRFKTIATVFFFLVALYLNSLQKVSAFTEEDFKAAPLATDDSTTQTKNSGRWPVSGNLSQGYTSYHPGIDIEQPLGNPIHAFFGGFIADTGFQAGGYGNYVLINHKNGYFSLYAHMDQISVSRGQDVSTDTVIGTVGLTGRTTGPHVHFEIYENGHTVNPLAILPATNTQLIASVDAQGSGQSLERLVTAPVSAAPIIEPKVEVEKPEKLYIKVSDPQITPSAMLR